MSPSPPQILGYIDIAQREGARLLTGGKQHGQKGYFVSRLLGAACFLLPLLECQRPVGMRSPTASS